MWVVELRTQVFFIRQNFVHTFTQIKIKHMATRSYIGTRNTDGTVDYIYCHFDGYPEHNGQILAEHYTNPNRVSELMQLGDLSVLGRFIGEKQDFDERVKDTCLAYGRDRGESNVRMKTGNLTELINDKMVSYVYVFDGENWECFNTSDPDTVINLYNITSSEV